MRLMDARAAGEVMGVSRHQLYRLAGAGVVPVVRVGRRVMFSEEQLREFVAQGGRALPGGWRNAPKP